MQINMLEAKSQLSKLVKAALEGEEVIIASNGIPMVKLVPLGKAHKLGWLGAAEKVRGHGGFGVYAESRCGDRADA